MNYLQKNRESTTMFKRLQRAIEMLNNKRKLFDIGHLVHQREYDSENNEDQQN